MSVLYLKEQGAYVEKRGDRLIVKKNRKELLDIPAANIDCIAVIGNVQITTQLLHHLMLQGVNVSYFSFGGTFIGEASSDHSGNIFLRLSQYALYQNPEKRIRIAKDIVNNKINNQIHLIENFNWAGADYPWRADVKQIRQYQAQVDEAETINQLMGIEGFCSHVYFQAYGKMMKGAFSFENRNRRPPKDPVNVILSLGYTFLTRETSMALEAESFEMYLGFLHGVRYGRKSLALDIVEEFRQPVIDRLTLRLFNKGMLGKYHFETEEGPVRLNEEGFTIFCREFERWMSDSAFSGEKTGFRSLIRRQASALKFALKQEKSYTPYEWRSGNVCDQL